jgi:hypothetical protein
MRATNLLCGPRGFDHTLDVDVSTNVVAFRVKSVLFAGGHHQSDLKHPHAIGNQKEIFAEATI